MQSSTAANFVSRAMSTAPQLAASSRAVASVAAKTARPLTQSTFRMRIIVDGRGNVQNSRLSTLKPLTRMSSFHSVAASTYSPADHHPAAQEPFVAEVRTENVMAMAGSMASFESAFAARDSYRPHEGATPRDDSEEKMDFRVGDVEKPNDVVLSNKSIE